MKVDDSIQINSLVKFDHKQSGYQAAKDFKALREYFDKLFNSTSEQLYETQTEDQFNNYFTKFLYKLHQKMCGLSPSFVSQI